MSESVAVWTMIAEWVAALGTAGALFFTLYILLRDRSAKARELGQAVTFSPVEQFHKKSEAEYGRYDLSLHIYNAGFKPLHGVWAVFIDAEGTQQRLIDRRGEMMGLPFATLGPQQEMFMHYTASLPDLVPYRDLRVSFVDGNGQPWLYNVNEHRLYRGDISGGPKLNWWQRMLRKLRRRR